MMFAPCCCDGGPEDEKNDGSSGAVIANFHQSFPAAICEMDRDQKNAAFNVQTKL